MILCFVIIVEIMIFKYEKNRHTQMMMTSKKMFSFKQKCVLNDLNVFVEMKNNCKILIVSFQ